VVSHGTFSFSLSLSFAFTAASALLALFAAWTVAVFIMRLLTTFLGCTSLSFSFTATAVVAYGLGSFGCRTAG